VYNVIFVPPVQRSLTYNIVVTCNAGSFQLVSTFCVSHCVLSLLLIFDFKGDGRRFFIDSEQKAVSNSLSQCKHDWVAHMDE